MKTILWFVLALVAACSTAPSEISSVPVPVTIRATIAGYQHRLDRSKFAIGDFQSELNVGGAERTEGSFGTFSVYRNTGFALAIPNADAPSRLRPPFSNSGEEHNRHAVAYFTAAGIPADQILVATAQATMEGDHRDQKLASYATVLSRVVDGIPIRESFASVTFNDIGEVVNEAVYWPELETSVVEQAKALRLAVSSRPAFFESRLPPMWRGSGAVIVHHSVSLSDGPFIAFALYTASPKVGLGQMVAKEKHLDLSGSEVIMPHEVETLPVMPSRGASTIAPVDPNGPVQP